MKWQFIDNREEQVKLLLSALRLPINMSEEMQGEAIISEYLRDCIYKLALVEGNSSQEISTTHTKKIRHVLNKQLGSIWPDHNSLKYSLFESLDLDTDEILLGINSIKNKLLNLQLIGDVLHIGNGYWAPTPPRFIQLSDQETIAFIGGCSTKYISKIADMSISQSGLGRLIIRGNIPKTVYEKKELWQPYEMWVGWIPKDMTSWTEMQMDRARKEGGVTLLSFETYEIFASFRGYRTAWIKAEELNNLQEKIVLLCRTSEKPSSYFLGVFENGQIIKEFPLRDKEIIAWLRIGLRILHGRTPYGRWSEDILKIYPPLPSSLDRQMLLYSYKKSPKEPVYYVLSNNRGRVEDFLKKYGYVLK